MLPEQTAQRLSDELRDGDQQHRAPARLNELKSPVPGLPAPTTAVYGNARPGHTDYEEKKEC